MISATAYDTHAEVLILGVGSRKKFFDDLDRFKKDIQGCDRHFNKDKRAWIVNNIEKYKEVPYIKNAMEDRQIQAKLF